MTTKQCPNTSYNWPALKSKTTRRRIGSVKNWKNVVWWKRFNEDCVLTYFNKKKFVDCKNIHVRDWAKSSTQFGRIYQQRQVRSVICLTYIFYVLKHGLKITDSSINSNPWKCESNFFLSFYTPAKVVIYQSLHSSNLAGFFMWFLKFSRLWNKFEVWV